MKCADDVDLYLAVDKDYKCVPVHTAVALFVYKFSNLRCVNVHLTHVTGQDQLCVVELDLQKLFHDNEEFDLLSSEQVPTAVKCCILPATLCNQGRLVISGLSSVLRQLVSLGSTCAVGEIGSGSLLGPRQNCLKACAEVSPWTKFCEQTVPSMVERVFMESGDSNAVDVFLQLERHLMQSSEKKGCKDQMAVVTNIKQSEQAKTVDTIADSIDKDSIFVEGGLLQLTDLILYFCFKVVNNYSAGLLQSVTSLARVGRWYKTVDCLECVRGAVTALELSNSAQLFNVENQFSSVQLADNALKDVHSTSSSNHLENSNGLVFSNRLHSEIKTKFRASQFAITRVLAKLTQVDLSFTVEPFTRSEICLPWSDYPDCVLPSTDIGGVPSQRAARKLEQLENMVEVVMNVLRLQQKDTATIVDFCSGGGHLGIVLAYLLPSCKLILVENKEQSLKRALARLEVLQLCNVTVVQCNLSCFQTSFDIGVSLHACGVVTDLVIDKCLQSGAPFVVCPCCYGAVRENHLIRYPRCRKLIEAGVSYADYLVLGHAADQTQSSIPKEDQGKLCMGYIDGDRAQGAVERGYNVNLFRMNPPTCSPKNHILIGFNKTLKSSHKLEVDNV